MGGYTDCYVLNVVRTNFRSVRHWLDVSAAADQTSEQIILGKFRRHKTNLRKANRLLFSMIYQQTDLHRYVVVVVPFSCLNVVIFSRCRVKKPHYRLRFHPLFIFSRSNCGHNWTFWNVCSSRDYLVNALSRFKSLKTETFRA